MLQSIGTKCRIFSGIQPTGIPHLGNYFGAIAQWIRMTNEKKVSLDKKEEVECDSLIFSIVDVHAYTATNPAYGQKLYNNILATTASLLALGLDHRKCILFRQSDLMEHNYLANVFDNFVTQQRLSHMTQFKDKSKNSKSVPVGLLIYPVLQAADILLYKANVVPVGEDQLQHIELTRDIAQKFNSSTNSQLFPEPRAHLDDSVHSRRIKSLRNPEKKMSKSDPNLKSFIEVIDEPDVIVEKCKKAVTDCMSAVYFDSDKRPGVSNLMRIYHLATGLSLEQIEERFKDRETAQLKLELADILIDKFSHARKEYKYLCNDKENLEQILQIGKSKAEPIARQTVSQVKNLLGSKVLN